jgi:hypothetical protein
MMRAAGMVMFVIGVIIASCYAARAVHPNGSGPGGAVTAGDRVGAWSHAAGAPFAAGMLLLVVGGLVTRSRRRVTSDEPAPQGSEHEGFAPVVPADQVEAPRPHTPPSELARPEVVLMRMAARLDGVPVEDPKRDAEVIQKALDEVLEVDISDFLEQREGLIERMGLTRFAEMMGHFAVAERNTARAWSALTDVAYDEVRPCIERARNGLAKARHALDTMS